jgi:hypothetical protein
MRRRIVIFATVGLALLPASYFGFIAVFEKLMIQEPWETAAYVGPNNGEQGKDALVPVAVYRLGPDKGKKIVEIHVGWGPHLEQALVIVVAHGQAFIGDELIPTDRITAALDAENKRGVNYVVISATRGTVIKDMIGVVDACRRSTMRAILLNETRVQ